MKEVNRNNGPVSIELLDDSPNRNQNGFFDSDNPEFSPPKEDATQKKKPWKRKLIGWSFILLIIAAGVFVLYLLLQVKRVDVRVLADSQRTSQSAKADPSPNNSEKGLSAEAINLARGALGADPTPTPNTASNNASATASPSPTSGTQRQLSHTENSPAYADSVAGDANSDQTNSSGNQQTAAKPSIHEPQTRANPTQTLFVEDLALKQLSAPQSPKTNPTPSAKIPEAIKSSTVAPSAVVPVFGTMLPVRTRGVIFTLRNNSYARLELVRDCQGEGWSLGKGTLLVGRVNGSEHDRAFVNIFGYIDPGTNRLVKMTGEVVGSDGGSGMQGKRIVVDRKRLKQTLGKVASSGLQVAGMMAGALTGRGTVVVNGAGDRVLNPITDEAGRLVNGADDKRSFVRIEAGQAAYVMVSDLPNEIEGVDAVGRDVLATSSNSLTDREVMELILFGTSEDIRAASPFMNEDQKRMVLKSIAPERSWP
jgi:hypothetical protein